MYNKKSYTIIEVVMATLLIGLVILTFLTSIITSFRYVRRTIELRIASLVLQEQVSRTRELAFSDIATLGGSFSSSSMASLENAVGTITKSLYNGQSEIYKITFTLDWTSFDNTAARKTVVTLITEEGINKK